MEVKKRVGRGREGESSEEEEEDNWRMEVELRRVELFRVESSVVSVVDDEEEACCVITWKSKIEIPSFKTPSPNKIALNFGWSFVFINVMVATIIKPKERK